MKSLDKLITEVRRSTRNTDSTSIIDAEFIEAFNDAQDRCQSILTSVYPSLFLQEEIISVVAEQESYSIVGKVYLNTRIKTVEYSPTGQLQDYQELESRTFKERITVKGDPIFYIRKENAFLLNPIPNTSTGTIRIVYEKELDDLDVRRALVTSTTGAPITVITLDNATFPTNADVLTLTTGEYVSCSTAFGIATANSVPVTSSTATSMTIPNHTLAAGEAIAAGSYLTLGKNSTTHSKLPDSCERYLKTYAEWKIFNRDSSDQAAAKQSELQIIEQDLLKSYANPSRDVTYIPILDEEIL